MIHGPRYWNDRERYYTQVNNPTEEQLRKAGVSGWLETCGPTAAVNCLGALGADLTITCPGRYRPQPEEVLADYLNDPANYGALRAARPDVDPSEIQGNRVPQDYPVAVREVFGVRVQYLESLGWLGVVGQIRAGHSVQICLIKPGHYLAAVAWDEVTNELIYHDSWPARVGGDGFCRRMSRDAYEGNVRPYVIIYGA